MKWSKLKQRLEERFAPEIGKRIRIHVTRYRESHDAEGELLVTLDGEKIYGAAFLAYYQDSLLLRASLRAEYPHRSDLDKEIDRRMIPEGHDDHYVLMKAAFLSLSQPIEEMLASPHVFIRGLAVLDARCGKRRLGKIDTATEHPLVARLHALRLAA